MLSMGCGVSALGIYLCICLVVTSALDRVPWAGRLSLHGRHLVLICVLILYIYFLL